MCQNRQLLDRYCQYRPSTEPVLACLQGLVNRIAAVVNLSFCNHDIILCMNYYRCVNYYHYIYTATSQMYPYMSPFLLEMPMYVYAISSIIITYYWRKSIEKFYTKN